MRSQPKGMSIGGHLLGECAQVLEERGAVYGPPQENFARMARYANAMWFEKLSGVITPEDCAKLMVGFKLARLEETPDHMDSHQDVIGYAAIFSELSLAENESAVSSEPDPAAQPQPNTIFSKHD